CLQGYSAPYRF
nr:immunoglobulin light chain junction region [Macaca mulatta]